MLIHNCIDAEAERYLLKADNVTGAGRKCLVITDNFTSAGKKVLTDKFTSDNCLLPLSRCFSEQKDVAPFWL